MFNKINRTYWRQDEFKAKTVIAAIRRGKSLCEFKDTFNYLIMTWSIRNANTQQRCRKNQPQALHAPLIISVPKGNYKAIHFIENGESPETD